MCTQGKSSGIWWSWIVLLSSQLSIFFWCFTSWSHSWHQAVQKTANMYGLPDPLLVLMVPPNKVPFKNYVHASILSFWSDKLTNRASNMPSFKLLRPLSLSLGHGPHPIITTCKTPCHVQVACIQAKMLVGTYRSCYHVRHWQHATGSYKLPEFVQFPGDLLHMFKTYPFLAPTVK